MKKKQQKPNKRQERLDKFEQQLWAARLLPQETKTERKRKAKAIRQAYELQKNDYYYIPRYHERFKQDHELANYIEILGDNK